MSKVINRLASL